jgi:hypothetical protein
VDCGCIKVNNEVRIRVVTDPAISGQSKSSSKLWIEFELGRYACLMKRKGNFDITLTILDVESGGPCAWFQDQGLGQNVSDISHVRIILHFLIIYYSTSIQ